MRARNTTATFTPTRRTRSRVGQNQRSVCNNLPAIHPGQVADESSAASCPLHYTVPGETVNGVEILRQLRSFYPVFSSSDVLKLVFASFNILTGWHLQSWVCFCREPMHPRIGTNSKLVVRPNRERGAFGRVIGHEATPVVIFGRKFRLRPIVAVCQAEVHRCQSFPIY